MSESDDPPPITYGKGKPRDLKWSDVLLHLANKQKFLCGLCGGAMAELELCNIDHIIPKSRGGTNRWKNLQATHIACNQEKGDELTARWSGRKWYTPRVPRRRKGR